MSIERRRHNRIDVQWPARMGKKGIGVGKAEVKDVSLGGVFIESALSIEAGDHVLLEMYAPIDNEQQRILAEGKIMHRKAMATGFGYGIQFVRIGDAALQQLLKVIAQNWKAS